MDDKELTKRIKNSFSAGLSRAEITRRMQKKGYKLEYIDALMKKSSPKKFTIISIIFIMILILATITYLFLFNPGTKLNLPNPLTGHTIANTNQQTEDITITPAFITYLINELGAYKLHKNLLTGEPAIINFNIQEQKFHSEINNNIKTIETPHKNPDIIITTSKQEIINSLSSTNPQQYMRQSIQQGKTKITQVASQSELLAKGYLSLYNTLKQ